MSLIKFISFLILGILCCNCQTMYFLANKSIYVNTERNDERAIVIFKDFYKDITIIDTKKGIPLFREKRIIRILNDSNALYSNNFQNLLNEREKLTTENSEIENKTNKSKEEKAKEIKNKEEIVKIERKIENYKINYIKTNSELNSYLNSNLSSKEKNDSSFEIKDEESAPMICIEPIGPAYTMNNSKLSGDKKNILSLPNIGTLDKGYNVTFSNDQAMSQIYTVSDVMQYAHASMFNLCLMYGNQVLTQDKYEESYKNLKVSIESLIETVMKRTEDKNNANRK